MEYHDLQKYLKENGTIVLIDETPINLYHKFSETKSLLMREYYPHIVIGALIDDPRIILNDHGINHVRTVISHAGRLINDNKIGFSNYEIYLLLISILFHDLGNIHRRTDHEKNISSIIDKNKRMFTVDDIELNHIKKIVYCHGGKSEDGDKDKLISCPVSVNVHGKPVRLREIAAILRFADELADDNTRYSQALLDNGKLTDESIKYHMYSKCLSTPILDYSRKSISLEYNIYKEDIPKKLGPDEEYLIDIIYERVVKMHYERIYCMRYLRPSIAIESIEVKIDFLSREMDLNLDDINFVLMEKGYPSSQNISIYDLCKGVKTNDNTHMDGEYICGKIGNEIGD